MAIKVCIKQVSFHCIKTSTIQPRWSSARVEWTCPACGEFLRKTPALDTKPYPPAEARRRLVRLAMRIHRQGD